MRVRITALVLVVSSILSGTAMAQDRHVVDPSAMRQAIAAQAVTDQQNRDVVLGVLHRPQVSQVASRIGLTVTRAEGALSTLTSAELASAAGSARAIDAQLAGGDTITISVTTLLLVIIIVILLVR